MYLQVTHRYNIQTANIKSIFYKKLFILQYIAWFMIKKSP